MAQKAYMGEIPTDKELQDFALGFDREIAKPLSEAGFDRYNIFDILNIGRQELRHSDFLAFLADGNRSGIIGQRFVKNFLALLARDYAPTELDFFEMYYGELEKADVYRETVVDGGRIDILMDIEFEKGKTRKIIVAIENKVDSDEHCNQLKIYRTALEKKYKEKGYKIIPLYLSPDKSKPKGDDKWIAIDYNFIYEVLNATNADDASSSIKILIDDYKEKIMNELANNIDSESKRKAVEIYKNNKEILDFIFACKPDWRKETADIIRDFLKKKDIEVESDSQNVNIVFWTKELKDYEGYFFQIGVDDMSLRLFKNKQSQAEGCPRKYFFENRQKALVAAEHFSSLVFRLDELKKECIDMLIKAFDKGGIVEQFIEKLPNKH